MKSLLNLGKKLLMDHQMMNQIFKINYNALISKFLTFRYYEEFKDIALYIIKD